MWLAPAPPLPLPSAPFFSAFVARSPAEEFPLPPLEGGYGGVVVLPRHRSAQRKRGREVAEQTLQLKNSFVDNFFYFSAAIEKFFESFNQIIFLKNSFFLLWEKCKKKLFSKSSYLNF